MLRVVLWTAVPFIVAACCVAPPKNPGTVPVHLVVNSIKGELADFYRNPVEMVRGSGATDTCKSPNGVQTVYLKPKTAKLNLKTVSGLENDPTAGLAAPFGVIAIDPSYTGAYSTSKAQNIEIDIEPVPLNESSSKLAKNDGKLTDQSATFHKVVSELAKELLLIDHTVLPCVKPTDVQVTVFFDVTNKSTVGAGIQVLGVKLGDKTSLDNELHQSVLIDFDIAGTSVQLAP